MKKENPDFLDWMADRLIQVYGERPNVDFVLALRRIAAEMRMLCTTAAQGAKFSITITGTRDECERAAGAWSSIQKDGGLLPPSTLSAAGGEDKRDAERYRLIRATPTTVMHYGEYLSGQALDDQCDAIAANQAKGDAS